MIRFLFLAFAGITDEMKVVALSLGHGNTVAFAMLPYIAFLASDAV